MQKTRIGIELDHVVRDINRQIVKYYQKDFDESIDLDEVDYKDDVTRTVCNFTTRKALQDFLYEDYPLEVFGHANQTDRRVMRELNAWLKELADDEEHEVEVFFYSLNEFDLTISSTYFFLSKTGSRMRKVVFPRDLFELSEMGDIFITANPAVVQYMALREKETVLVRMNFNRWCEDTATLVYDDFMSFLDGDDRLGRLINKDNNICKERKSKRGSLWTWMRSLTSCFRRRRGT